MYNRYVPQADGSYVRNRLQEPRRPSGHTPPPERKQPSGQDRPQEKPCEPEHQEHQNQGGGQNAPGTQSGHGSQNRPSCQTQVPCQPRKEPPQGGSVGAFLRQLLPKNFDTGDLLVVLLILLMAGDCSDDSNTALLTLVLYLFL